MGGGDQREARPGGRRPRRHRIRAGLRRHGLVPRPGAIRRFLREHQLVPSEGNRVDLFWNGREGLGAMLAEIERAQSYVHLETYILRTDAVGLEFIAALERRAQAGVDVRLLYDDLGSRGIDGSALAPLVRAGGAVTVFNPLRFPSSRFAARRRDHRKILVVDGRAAFTGGLNIGLEYQRGLAGGDAEWRDAHVRIEGPAVRDLEAVFLESWFRADGPDLPWASFLAQAPPRAGDVRCAVVADGPSHRRRRMRDLLISALEGASSDARLASPYLAPGRRVLEALSAASRRGVRVDLLLAGHTDHPVLRRAARSNLPRLLDAGVRVFEYERSMMHAKLAVFDGEWCVLGTSNLDRQSFEHSHEVNLVLDGGGVPERIAAQLDLDLARGRRVDRDSLAARGWLERLVDRAAALVLFFV
jgi:cardiolipin synthase